MTAFVFAVVMNFVSYWFSDKIVLKMYRAQEVGPDHRLCDHDAAAGHAGGPADAEGVRHSRHLAERVCHRAQPQHAAVAATEGILRLLNDEELEGVIAHELAHVKHRDILISSVAATLAAAIMMVARMAQFARCSVAAAAATIAKGRTRLRMIATIIFAPIAAMLIQAAISRSREFEADAGGAAIAGTPYGLVNALRKLESGSKQMPLDANPATAHMFIIKPFSAGGLLGMFSTHPPTEQRIQALMNLR